MGSAVPGDHQTVGNAWSEFVPFLDYDVESGGSSAAPTPSNPSTPVTAGG